MMFDGCLKIEASSTAEKRGSRLQQNGPQMMFYSAAKKSSNDF